MQPALSLPFWVAVEWRKIKVKCVRVLFKILHLPSSSVFSPHSKIHSALCLQKCVFIGLQWLVRCVAELFTISTLLSSLLAQQPLFAHQLFSKSDCPPIKYCNIDPLFPLLLFFCFQLNQHGWESALCHDSNYEGVTFTKQLLAEYAIKLPISDLFTIWNWYKSASKYY